jgi:hypothetical protein
MEKQTNKETLRTKLQAGKNLTKNVEWKGHIHQE